MSLVTSQLAKLGIRPGIRLDVVGASPAWRIEESVDAAEPAPHGPADVILLFCRSAADLAAVETLAERIRPAGALWIAWPRKAAGHVSDLGDAVVRDTLLSTTGLVDTKVAMIDTDWSGLKFVWRLANR